VALGSKLDDIRVGALKDEQRFADGRSTMNGAFCTSCGKAIAANDDFCAHCGCGVVRGAGLKLCPPSTGLTLAGISGGLLMISLALSWFTIRVPYGEVVNGASEVLAGKQVFSPSTTGFGTSTPLGILLLVCGAVPLIAAGHAAVGRSLPISVPRHWVLMGCGTVAVLIIVYLTLKPPKLIAGGNLPNGLATLIGIRPTPQLGMFLGLISALGIIGGASLTEGGPLAPASVNRRPGRLRIAIAHASAGHSQLALVSLGAGVATLLVALVGFVADSATVVGVALAGGAVSVVAARFARQRALAAGDSELVFLTRFGQSAGWVVIGIVGVLLVIVALALGQTVQDINQASGGGI
jgi:hypothetical protein